VFDPDCLFRFLDAIEEFPIPMVAGIRPFTSFKNAELMANEVPGVVVPPRLLDRMSRATTKEQGRVMGMEIARELITAIRDRVAGCAVSAPFGNVETALAILGKADMNAGWRMPGKGNTVSQGPGRIGACSKTAGVSPGGASLSPLRRQGFSRCPKC
jgi:hypothetical protein